MLLREHQLWSKIRRDDWWMGSVWFNLKLNREKMKQVLMNCRVAGIKPLQAISPLFKITEVSQIYFYFTKEAEY